MIRLHVLGTARLHRCTAAPRRHHCATGPVWTYVRDDRPSGSHGRILIKLRTHHVFIIPSN